MDIAGLIYLLNQAGVALSEANQTIARLSKEIDALRSESSRNSGGTLDS